VARTTVATLATNATNPTTASISWPLLLLPNHMAYIRPENDMLIVAANVKIITFRISTLRIPDRAFKRISMRQAAKQAILNEPKDEPKAQTKWMGLFIGFSEYLVELTGIEPVASWLQTRRSPS
jgi:hypothetical protein